MAEIGKLNNLAVLDKFDHGVYLDGEELGRILLPIRYVPDDCETGDVYEVFIHHDSEDRLVAVTDMPFAMVGDFALLKAISVTKVGAFLDWGLQKDLMVPFAEQKQKMEQGRSYIVYIYIDERTNRIVASEKTNKFLDTDVSGLSEGEEVSLFITSKTDLGYKAIVNNSHTGVIYENEVYQELERGQKIKGFIKKIRVDNKLDLCLQKAGFEKVDELTDIIINQLKANNGFSSINDKSSSELIQEFYGVSKKTFKKAVGALYKKKLITIEEDGIRLV